MTKLSFNLHDIVGFYLSTEDQNARRFFTQELGKFESSDGQPNKIVNLNWQPRQFPILEPEAGKYAVHKVFARWRFELDWHEDEVHVTAAGTEMALPMVHHMLTQPSMRYLASQDGYLMLHGASLAHNGRSLLITGRGGTGKTTVSSLLLGEGEASWQFQSDDYTFLGPGPVTLSFPARSHLYRDILYWQPQIARKLTLRERIALSFFGSLRKWSRDGVTWPVRVEIERIWPNRPTIPSARLAGIVLLSRGGTEISLEEVDASESIIDDLIRMNFDEARHFIRLVEMSPSRPPGADWLRTWRRAERSFLEDRAHDTPFFQLRLPEWRTHGPNPVRALEKALLPLVAGPES